MIQRLRPRWDDAALAALYAEPHDHRRYGRGHGERVAATIDLALGAILTRDTVADLSCGNGVIARALTPEPILGDYAPGYPITGPLETTLGNLTHVDVYVLSETLEHLDDPEAVLRLIRDRSTWLVLSTPLEAWGDTNAEHYWAWDRIGVEDLLAAAGWVPVVHDTVDSREYGEPYLYGIWVAC